MKQGITKGRGRYEHRKRTWAKHSLQGANSRRCPSEIAVFPHCRTSPRLLGMTCRRTRERQRTGALGPGQHRQRRPRAAGAPNNSSSYELYKCFGSLSRSYCASPVSTKLNDPRSAVQRLCTRALDDYALAEIENGPRLGWFRSKSGAAGLLCRT
jgi:hypothetical protein